MSNPTVKLSDGIVRGACLQTLHGKPFYSFMGIPYAEPPIGRLRFKNPVPVKPWTGIKDATEERGISAQVDMFTNEYKGCEDCLYINVHTPQLKRENTKPLPVIVKIHGGGFVNGAGNRTEFGPDYIVEENVILAIFNYRLGVMGFLCTDPVNARGDMGLRDQVLALKWIQQNIAAFNGDPNNVTIFGISAGGAAVEYHLLSPLSENLFHKAIIQSGSILNPWARMRKPIESAMSLAKAFGYKSDSIEGLFDFINKIDVESLVKACPEITTNSDIAEGILFPFTPVVNFFKDGNEFLNEEPADALKNGRFAKVPIISGFVEKEGMFMRWFYRSDYWQENFKNKDFIKAIPSWMDKNVPHLDAILKSTYIKRDNDKNVDDNIMDFLSDVNFTGGMFFALEQRLRYNPNEEYSYYFTYDGKMNLCKIELCFDEAGACHADEWSYLGTVSTVCTDDAIEEDWLMKSRLVKMWTDFVKIGNPTPKLTDIINEKWLAVKTDEYLNIGKELKMDNGLISERRKIWAQIYGKL